MTKEPAFRTTITIPSDVKKRMDAVKEDVNWSALATAAFQSKLDEIARRKEKRIMTDYFGEKTSQFQPSGLTVFGIDISSRYDQADEIKELMTFAELVAKKKVTPYVKRAWYNSKVRCCTIELDPNVHEGDAVADAVHEAAIESITQFDWFGTSENGKPAADLLD